MVTIDKLIDRLGKIDLEQVIDNTLVETRKQYIAQQKQQMLSGKRSDGSMIGKYANKAYAARKSNPVASAGNVDLKDTGAFQAAIFLDPRKSIFVVDSTDEKSEMLQKKYGESICGLNDESNAVYIPIAQQEAFKQITNALS